MAAMYSLFLGFLLTAICSSSGDGDCVLNTEIVSSSYAMSTVVEASKNFKRTKAYGMQDKNNDKALRQSIIAIALKELGVRESTGNNDGLRVEEYLRYTGLDKGHEWCAAFVSWCYGQVGRGVPRNPWSPALFPRARSYRAADRIQGADVFGIYSAKVKRINHVGLVKEKQGRYLITLEGNSKDRVASRRRHLRTIDRYADWL